MVAGIADGLNSRSNMLRICSIEFRVSPHESNVQDSKFVFSLHYKPELVTTDVENNAISFNKARVSVSAFDVLRA